MRALGYDHFTKKRQRFTKPSVSVLVTAFQAESFICETLDSLNKQVFKDFQLLISIDKSVDDTELVIKSWCQEHKNIRTRIFCHTHRLGWIKNINFLLKKCKTKYFMLMPHDDLLDGTYIQKMVQCLKVNPNACTAFSDIQGFGGIKPIVTENSIMGNRMERTLVFLIHHFNAVAFRGLVNRDVISDFMSLPENDCSNFAIDTIWDLQMSLKGELIRVPEVLYHKRFHEHGSSIGDSWRKFSKVKVYKAWLEHCQDCLKIIFRVGFEPEELVRLIAATKSRLVQDYNPLGPCQLFNPNEKDRDSVRASLVENLEKTIIVLGEAENYSRSQFSHVKYK